MTVLEVDVRPVGPYRLPPAGRDRVLRRRGEVLERLIHTPEGAASIVRAWACGGAVRFAAEAADRETAAFAIERMRFALGTDQDLGPFIQAFKRDRLIGPAIRLRPWLRPRRRPEPFEALAWAVCEQLIEGQRATDIEKAIVARHGRRSSCGTLRDVPTAAVVARLSPAELDACGLAPKRSLALVKAAREVASGRADLSCHEPSWQRLLAISNIGPWTVEYLALHGQGRDDQLPHGDLAYVKLVGRALRLGRRATVDEVREFFAPYAPFAGLAGTHLVTAVATGTLRLGR